MSDDVVRIKVGVEMGFDTHETIVNVDRKHWDSFTEKQKNDLQTEIAVQEQNNVAPCWSEVLD